MPLAPAGRPSQPSHDDLRVVRVSGEAPEQAARTPGQAAGLEGILDRPGDWEVRVTIYRNGKRVGTCDTTGWSTFDAAAYRAGQGLATREISLHQPKLRAKP